jgi:hypothetical protein
MTKDGVIGNRLRVGSLNYDTEEKDTGTKGTKNVEKGEKRWEVKAERM